MPSRSGPAGDPSLSLKPAGDFRFRHAALVGTTASGKSSVAMAIAEADPIWEIVVIDSMQVYRGMDIGTAKPTADEQRRVRHHLLDLAEPTEDFSVVRFREAFEEAMADIEARDQQALLVGGTGLYLRAVIDDLEIPGQYPAIAEELHGDPDTAGLHRRLHELDPLAASRMEPGNRRRVIRALEVTLGSGRPFSSFGPGLTTTPATPFALFGLRLPDDMVRDRIAERYDEQMKQGFLAEVDQLHQRPLSRTARQALGYKELLAHLDGELELDEALDLAVRRTRRFARRQRVWFRRDPRIRWIDVDDPAAAVNVLADTLRGLGD